MEPTTRQEASLQLTMPAIRKIIKLTALAVQLVLSDALSALLTAL